MAYTEGDGMIYFNNYSTEFIRVTGEVCCSARGIEAEQLFLHWSDDGRRHVEIRPNHCDYE